MSEVSFLSRFEAQADLTPNAAAVTFEGRSLSYLALDQRSTRLANELVARGVASDDIVAIGAARSLEVAVFVLAVLKAGAGYLPLDPSYPEDRLAFMLDDARARFLLKSPDATMPSACGAVTVLAFGVDDPRLTKGAAVRVPHRHRPDGIAYAIYTSGSTGKPKGVAMVHRALDNLISWQLTDSAAGEGTATLQFAPLSFDVHFQEMFGTWCSGGRLVLVREALRLEMLKLLDLIEHERIERLFLPFIALQSLADIAVTHEKIPRHLREVITAGEQLQVTRPLVALFTALPEARLFNHYGPSETHVVTSLRLDGPPENWPALPPIGHALPNVTLEILTDDGHPVAPGGEGELYIGGVALARGYLHRPELTAERFVTRGASRHYRTGDLVKALPDGALQFLGRLDGQVKIRGYRIEIGEIEVALSAFSGVREAAVAVREAQPGDKRLIAYVVGDGALDVAALRRALEEKLPEYMLPSSYVALERLPRTPSGKVDKRALPAPTRARPTLAEEYVPPRSEREQRLHAIWSELLGIDAIGVHDKFFALGGNSLLALRAVANIQRAFAVDLPIVQFFERATIAAQAAYLDDPSAIGEKRARRTVRRGSERAQVAIIGMAGRFPGAASIDALFENLLAGVSSIERFSPSELDPAVPSAERDDPAYVPARGVLRDADSFDAAFFGVSPSEAAVLDPQQRILLELAVSALEHAGYPPFGGQHVVGVYAGTHNNTYYASNVLARPDAIARLGTFATMVASEKDYVATRIAHKLDLTGPALSIHTACSTSLVAIATAVQHLRSGLCELALAGGASLTVPQRSGHVYQEGGMLSRDGETRPFDADASGTVFSDGAGMVVLKLLDDALRDGDSVYAVIRGVGLNNDGGTKASFTAPSVEGQRAVIAMAQADADVSPRAISYVEAHGTATPLGDPIEVEALTSAFRTDTDASGFCGLGSIKSNLGHLTAAAGVAGVVKVALSLHHERLPPSLGFKKPNPNISFATSPFYVVDSARPWPRGQAPRIAAVSSFGVGGTNAHVVLAEAPLRAPTGPSIAPQLLVLSAKTDDALARTTEALAAQLEAVPALPLADAAYTLAIGRTPFAVRRAVVATSARDAAAKLMRAGEGARGRVAAEAPAIAFMFPGQGAQYPAMGKNLYDAEPTYRLVFDQCAEVLRPALGHDLAALLYGDAAQDAEQARQLLRQTEITQSALFVVEIALARTLRAWGIAPSCLVGHSVGEFTAACLAGVLTLEDALRLVATRGKLMQSMPSGAMLSVRAGSEQLLKNLPEALDLACENAAGLSVLAGPVEALRAYGAELERQGIASKELATSHAFHSRSMDPAVSAFRAAVDAVRLAAPTIPIVSTATGTWLTDAEAQDPAYWASHMRRTVQFRAALETLGEGRVLLEVGPGRALSTLALARRAGDARPKPKVLSTLPGQVEGDAEWTALLATLGALWVQGASIDFPAFYGAETRRRVPLPGTSFERTRHWLDRPTEALPRTSGPAREVGEQHPQLGTSEGSARANGRMNSEVFEMSSESPGTSPRTYRLIGELRQLFEDTSGLAFDDASPDASFIELGVDSLLVTQLANRLKQTFKVPITFRQLMEDVSTFAALAAHLDKLLPAEPAPAASVPATAVAQGTPAAPAQVTAPAWPTLPAALPAGGPLAFAQQLIQLQVAQMALFQQQLSLLTAPGTPAAAPQPPAIAAIPTPTAIATPEAIAKAPVTRDAQAPAASGHGQNTYDPQKAFGAIARIYKQSDTLTPKQQARLKQLEERYCEKTKKSKAHTQQHRRHHADPRVVTGFKPRIKELIYPLVTARASGCRLWDLDGNEYVDALNGFGSNFFGYSAPMIADALRQRIDLGFEIGPQTPFAGESAELVCALTGMDRAAFCNTGSEAVMGALRIARTVTGRSLVVAFSGSYHGIFDEVIVRDTKTMKPIPASPGILPEAVQNMLILEYGTEQTLAIIRERADELAAVLVEPVQSRRPDFRPKAFLEQVRAITRDSGSALIFDEVITGFRVHPGGAQAYFGIEADLATYGKVVGGGMPIGVIAGRDPWMDALDGGVWQYGDDSTPTAGVTYFAGTFVRHPMTMAAAHAALRFMQREGPALQERLNATTSAMAEQLNAFFRSVGAPLEIRHFSSLWKTFFTEPQPYGELLFCYLRDRGVHIWDGFPCFLTLAHGEAEVAFIVNAFKDAVREMQAGQFLPGVAEPEQTFDASKPPVPGARLGRDPHGNPAWFVPNPEAPGKYLRVS